MRVINAQRSQMSSFAPYSPDLSAFPVMREPQAACLRTGIDVVQISRVRASIASFGDRFFQRLFAADEIAYARSEEALAAERLAARFAAKEAAIKAFGLAHAGIDWREIEVHRRADGDCSLRLHGRAALRARAPRAEDVALSLSHDGDYAVAIVTALNVSPPEIHSAFEIMTTAHPLDDKIKTVLRNHGRLNKDAMALSADADLYQAGLTSHASVNVMLGLEGLFDIEFPDQMLTRSVFGSVEAIRSALLELRVV